MTKCLRLVLPMLLAAPALGIIEQFDFGDAPAPYPTTLKDGGARHLINFSSSLRIGTNLDPEEDGIPSAAANGDDLNPSSTAPDDEDGVVFGSLVPGQTGSVTVLIGRGDAALSAWIDFNGDGVWDEKEIIINSAGVGAGSRTFTFPVPAESKLGTTFSRFRLSSKGQLAPTGDAPDGEVEDHQVTLGAEPLDYGDAMEGYPVTASQDGARHRTSRSFYLGALADVESNGQPSLTATGDDENPKDADDEDGVLFTSGLVTGQNAKVTVIAGGQGGILDAFIDFNRNKSWEDSGEKIFNSVQLVSGENNLSFMVPAAAGTGGAFARFRLSSKGGLKSTGPAPDGEVEDYIVGIESGATFDFGDAPQSYPVVLSQDGARHRLVQGILLGQRIDQEANGQPSSAANADDLNPPGGTVPLDDEDGVSFPTGSLQAGFASPVTVVSSTDKARLDAWVDFDGNGNWEAAEEVLDSVFLTAGSNTLTINLPSTAKTGPSFARFRLSMKGGLAPTGPAEDGEVEDYAVTIAAQPLDFGDAPQSFPVLASQNGARHRVVQGIFLGQRIDQEPDGQPSIGANGDDLNPPGGTVPLDDEDGVTFPGGSLQAGFSNPVTVVSSTERARLDAWVDIDGSGTWEAGEKVLDSVLLTAGVNNLAIGLPASAIPGATFARFRLSMKGGLQPTGLAEDGEVEDHTVTISPQQLDYGDAPQSYPTLLGQNGARHRFSRGFTLGRLVDVESDGQPSLGADGDDMNPTPSSDDEDGVRFIGPLEPAGNVPVEVVVSGGVGFLDAWVDFNGDGDWADAAEQIFTSRPVSGGTNIIAFVVPQGARVGATYARFRLSHKGALTFTGLSADGEVEDYRVTITERPVPCIPRTNRGTDFWLTFPGNYDPDPDNRVRLSLCIIGPRATAGKVEIPGIGFVEDFVIPGDMEVTIALPRAAELDNANDLIEKKGIHVTANAEVAVFGMNKVRWTSDGYLGLPTDVLGKDYVIQGYGNEFSGVPDLNGTQIALVGTVDNTTVNITPRVSTLGHPAGVPFAIKLNQGETYQLRNTNDFANDLTGTLISADQPISVFGSHQCANIPDDDYFFCDYIVEQLLPIERAGTTFVTMPLRTRVRDTYRITALQDNTQIQINGAVVATINRHQTFEGTMSIAARIVTSAPVLAAQYANSSDYDGVVNADPFMIVLPHVNMFKNSYWVCTPMSELGFADNWISIVAPSNLVGSILLDGNPVPAAQFTPIFASGWSGARIKVNPGAHVLSANAAFGVTAYGWSEYESYGYPGGMFFGDTVPPRLDCPETITVTLQQVPGTTTAPCTVPVPDIREQVNVSDDCGLPTRPVLVQEPKPGTLVGPGTHVITVSAVDSSGNVGTCQTVFQVVDPSPVTLNCPEQIVVQNCNTPDGARVTFDITATGRCGTVPLEYEATPPSGSVFPKGETIVSVFATDAQGKTYTCTFKVIVNCGDGPTITAVHTVSNQITLQWQGSAVLEQAASVTGPWSPVATAQGAFTVAPVGQKAFYRLRQGN